MFPSQAVIISAVKKRSGHRLLLFSRRTTIGNLVKAWNSPPGLGSSQTIPFSEVTWAMIVATKSQPKIRHPIDMATIAVGVFVGTDIPTSTHKNEKRNAHAFPRASVVAVRVGVSNCMGLLTGRHFRFLDDPTNDLLFPLSGVHCLG